MEKANTLAVIELRWHESTTGTQSKTPLDAYSSMRLDKIGIELFIAGDFVDKEYYNQLKDLIKKHGQDWTKPGKFVGNGSGLSGPPPLS